MIYLVVITILIILVVPSIWVKYTIKKFSTTKPELPGTGGQFAEHLLKRFDIDDVEVIKGKPGEDSYSPLEQVIRLSPDIYEGKSISAVAISAHEVGHAIQYHRKESITRLREKYTPAAQIIEKLAIGLLGLCPILIAIFKLPQLGILTVVVGIITVFISVILQLIILPMEWDASFNKALPILEAGEYLDNRDIPAATTILRAAAMTYVAATLSSLLNVWRWLAILRR
jgi:Zn-dependent membrane protease YugP